MKKAVITLLGTISNSKPDYISVDGKVQKIFVDISEEDRAVYTFSENLNEFSTRLTKERYINTLPLLIDAFGDREIIPIATQKAKDIQAKTLDFLKLDASPLDNTVIIDETDYEGIFEQISELLQRKAYESFIIDLTHGFRHLPILMIINLIITSIKDLDKIEHIFFAKEIENAKKYEIIDLLDYIGLAKLSFVLQNFNTNYTVGNKLSFKNEQYQELVDSLRIISGHILGNSIKRLIDGENSLITETIKKFRVLQKTDKKIETFSLYIDEIIEHLQQIQDLKGQRDYIKLFRLSQMMKDREYLLNAITLLNESMGMYCADKIRNISPEISLHIDAYLKEYKASLYELSHQSKNLVKLEDGFNGSYLSDKLPKTQIVNTLKKQNHSKLKNLIREIEKLRNNLAHGNSSEEIENVKGRISTLLREYERFIGIPKEETKKIEPIVLPIEIKKEVVVPKKKKEKIVATGIDAPKEQVSNLFNHFSNR